MKGTNKQKINKKQKTTVQQNLNNSNFVMQTLFFSFEGVCFVGTSWSFCGGEKVVGLSGFDGLGDELSRYSDLSLSLSAY